MKIKEGEKLPDSKLFIIDEGHKEISTKKGGGVYANEVMKLIQFYAKFFNHNEN